MADEQDVILVDFGSMAGVRGVASYSAVDMYEKSDEAVEKAMTVLKTTGSSDALRNAVFRYKDYEKVVNLPKWLEIDEKYGN